MFCGIFCNIKKVFTVTFDQFNCSIIIKLMDLWWTTDEQTDRQTDRQIDR